MTLGYSVRLACLALACFFVAHLGMGLLVAAAAPWLERRRGASTAAASARLMLTLRMLPLAVALGVVMLLCVPSFVLLEGDVAGERVGALCLFAAAAGALQWTRAAVRTARAIANSTRLASDAASSHRPVAALYGLLRPRLIVSERVRRELEPREFRAVLEHEAAHGARRDNWARLLMVASPDLLPGWRPLERLERAWARYAEWAADDAVVRGDRARSLALASALVRVARMGGESTPVLATSLVGQIDALAERVERLLEDRAEVAERAAGRGYAVAILLAVALVTPAALPRFHELLERLIR